MTEQELQEIEGYWLVDVRERKDRPRSPRADVRALVAEVRKLQFFEQKAKEANALLYRIEQSGVRYHPDSLTGQLSANKWRW